MNNMIGADPEQLREFARAALKGSEQLARAESMISTSLSQSRWQGPDSQRFKAKWGSDHRTRLKTVGAELRDIASALKRNAEEQEKASAVDSGGAGGAGGSGGPDGDRSDRDQPGDPDPFDGMGEYHDLPEDIPLDDEALDPTNMEQGTLGDCWFLAAAGAVAKNDPDWIRDHMEKNDDGTWTVKMYKDGEPVYITVEGTVPEGSVHDASGNDNWLSIYEKAAAEYFGGDYEDLDGGFSHDGLAAITGQDVQKSGETNFDDLSEKLENGPVAVGTEDEPDGSRNWFFESDKIDDDRIVPNHAYIVDTVETRENPDTGESEKMIHLINPWGPNGGNLEGDTTTDGQNQRWGDIWLTEEQYKENFDSVYSSASTKD